MPEMNLGPGMNSGKDPTAQRRIADLLDSSADVFGDALAVAGEGARLTFAELRNEVQRAGAAFVAAGVAHGDRIAAWAPNSAAWIVAALALQTIGGVLVPLNTRFKAVEAASLLRRVRPRLLLTVCDFLGQDYAAMLESEIPDLPPVVLLNHPANPSRLAWRDFLRGAFDAPALDARIAAVRPGDTADILFTSGTTGHPKGAMHSQAQMLWAVDIWNRTNDLRPGDRQLVVNPFFHSFGYRMGFVSGVMAGMATWPMAVFDPLAAMTLIARERITVLMGSPTLFASILDHPRRSEFDLSSLRVAHTGSSNVPVDLIRRLRAELGFDLVLTSYGLTEATALVTANTPDSDFETIARTVGLPIAGVELRIAEGTGELLVRGPNVMQGYFEDPAATAEAIDGAGWLHTGDVGEIRADGRLRILDRIKDVVIVGGFNAYPAEIENVLATHPAIAEVAVVAVPDPRLGEVCGAAVVLRRGTGLTPDELAAWSRERLANYKVPRHLMICAALPRTPLGKPQKFLLREQMRAMVASAGTE